MKLLCGIFIGLLCGFVQCAPTVPTGEKTLAYWDDLAEQYIRRRVALKENTNIAKNVILFIGDGLGGTTVTASRILRGQLNGRPGEETVLKFEEFPHIALSKTYNMDRQVPDSAGTATAIMSGRKTNWYMIGMDGTTVKDDCEGSKGKHVDTMLDWAKAAGKRTGIVSTARITHATPAAAYAHVPNRRWEGSVPEDITGGCKDIAQQLIDDNWDINVVFGGGRKYFLPDTVTDPETNTIDADQRKDGRNLVQDWLDKHKDRGENSADFKYIWNRQMFDETDPRYVKYVLGLFEPSHMQYELDRRETNNEPSLADMTRKAIQILKNDPQGYFLMVEGARIDHAHHASLVKHALYETLAMEDAIRDAVDMTDENDTLIIVTGDHSHAFDIQGYPNRGNNILGLTDPIWDVEPSLDGKPYTTLIYANGPGWVEPRANLTETDLSDKNYVWPAGIPVVDETHGGEDVSIYALGPMAHMFHGVHEQSYIGHVMAYSTCVWKYKTPDMCKLGRNFGGPTSGGDLVVLSTSSVLFSHLMFLLLKLFMP